VAALMRRLTIIKLDKPYKPPAPPQWTDKPENDNPRFWKNAPSPKAGIPIGDVMEVPEWRDYLGDLLAPSPEPEPELGPIPESWQPQAKPLDEMTPTEQLKLCRETGKYWAELFGGPRAPPKSDAACDWGYCTPNYTCVRCKSPDSSEGFRN